MFLRDQGKQSLSNRWPERGFWGELHGSETAKLPHAADLLETSIRAGNLCLHFIPKNSRTQQGFVESAV
jgi:hypothetical protein